MIERLLPASMAGQMILVLALSFAALLAVLTIAEQQAPGSIYADASNAETARRIGRMAETLSRIRPEEMTNYVRAESLCHFGYEVSDGPYTGAWSTAETEAVADRIAEILALGRDRVRAGRATLPGGSFGYAKCPPGDIAFPVEGLVISVRLPEGRWVHAEVHPHEPHFQLSFANWFQRSALAFVLIATIAALFMLRLARPLRTLTAGARKFGAGLKVEPILEAGPPDLRESIAAFNVMQRQVADSITQRNLTLAALSHDLRAPLTALRVKAELVEDTAMRDDLVASIRRMEALSASAIEFLQGEGEAEPMRLVDLSALVESECSDFSDAGAGVTFSGGAPIRCHCRPEALARAIRNLVENALKYGGDAQVSVTAVDGSANITVADHGPGIPANSRDRVLEPFVRLSEARESQIGGAGLGLAVVKAVAEGHGGRLTFEDNTPNGTIALLAIPIGVRAR